MFSQKTSSLTNKSLNFVISADFLLTRKFKKIGPFFTLQLKNDLLYTKSYTSQIPFPLTKANLLCEEKVFWKYVANFQGNNHADCAISIKLQSNFFFEITLQHGCSAVNLLHIFSTPFYKNILEGCFCSYHIFWLIWKTVNVSGMNTTLFFWKHSLKKFECELSSLFSINSKNCKVLQYTLIYFNSFFWIMRTCSSYIW